MLYLLLFAFLIGLDRVSKLLAEKLLRMRPIDLLHGVLSLDYVRNRGAAFGILGGKTGIMIAAAAIVCLALGTYLIAKRKSLPKIAMIGGTLVLAGTIGNLVDRIALGYVIDFINVYAIRFPLFNVADMCICVGMVLFGIYLIFLTGEEEA